MTITTSGAGWATAAGVKVRELLPHRRDLVEMVRHPRADLTAGLTVAFVALPLALAFGISSGMGAAAGLVTAIVAGVVAAFLGGSNVQISGPTGAMAVVLLPIVGRFGPSAVLVVGLLAGLVLIGLAVAGAGRYMQYVPLPVVEGFTLGIAVIIGLQQVPSLLGVSAHGGKVVLVAGSAVRDWLGDPRLASLLIGLAVAASMLLTARLRPGFPVSLLAVAVATAVVSLTDLNVATIGAVPSGLPSPSAPAVPWGQLSSLLLPAVAVAALAALESLLSAAVADGMSVGERHDPNRELLGQGLANLAVPFFGGIPATAAIARTAVNVRSGARSRAAAVTQSVTLLLVTLVAATWVARIPLAALAGVLLATVVQMVEVSNLRALLKATRGDAVVLVATAIATVVFDLVTAVLVGLVIASLYALRQLSESAQVEEVPLEAGDHSVDEQALLAEHVVAYRLDGPLYFGGAHRFLLEISEVGAVRVVILRLSRVRTLDATGATVLGQTIKDLEARGITVLLSGIRPDHASVFQVLGVYDELAHERHVFATTPEAIAHARAHVHKHHDAL